MGTSKVIPVRKYCSCYRVVNIWNSLPDYVVEADSMGLHVKATGLPQLSIKKHLAKIWQSSDMRFSSQASRQMDK